MLYVYFGEFIDEDEPKVYVESSNRYFDGYFDDSWTSSDWAKRVISEIDKSTLISPKAVNSPWFGIIPVTSISGGAKNLIIADNITGIVLNGDKMGDNCWKLLLELSKTKDIALRLWYSPLFDWVDGAEVYVLNYDRVVNNYLDFFALQLKSRGNDPISFDSVDWHIELNHSYFEEDDSWMYDDSLLARGSDNE